MKIRIDIEFITFNSEYQADIFLSDDCIKYIASDNLDELMNTIKMRVLEYQKEMTAK